ncbi:MAG: hypothetical protein JNM43_02590 [Planctomycetaceae bacterium]|nr:hypothetical protein [Planctomycetaceae bacterium]
MKTAVTGMISRKRKVGGDPGRRITDSVISEWTFGAGFYAQVRPFSRGLPAVPGARSKIPAQVLTDSEVVNLAKDP